MQLWRMLAKRQVLTHLILAFRKASSSSLPKSKDTSSVSSTRAWGTPSADGRRWPSPPLPSLLEGPLPPRRQSEAFCPPGVRPRPPFAHPSFSPPLSLLLTAPLPCPELSQAPPVLSPTLPPQHPRGPTCFMLPRAHLEPTAQAPAPAPAPAWPECPETGEPRPPRPSWRPAVQVSGGGGERKACGARGAQSAVAGWGGGLGGPGGGGAWEGPRPRARWGKAPETERPDSQAGGTEGLRGHGVDDSGSKVHSGTVNSDPGRNRAGVGW